MSKRLGVTYIFLCSLIWATMPLTFKFILGSISPFALVGINFVSATISLLIILLLIDRKGLVSAIKGYRGLMLLGGILLGIQLIIFMSGLSLTTAIAAQILVQTEAVYFVVWGFIFFHEKLTGKRLLGIVLAIIGVFIVSWNGEDLGVLISSQYFIGNLIILLGSFIFSIYMALQKRFSEQGTGLPTLFPMFLTASLITVWLVPAEELTGLSVLVVGALGLTGVLIALSYLFFAKSLEHISSSTISVILLASPVMTFIMVTVGRGLNIPFFSGETLTAYILLGGAAIIIGAFMVIFAERS